ISKLEENGYTLAKGNRRRFVLVDSEGNIHSLTRQLNKEQRKEHLEKLSDISHQALPLAQEVIADRQYFDRDKQEREQLQRIEDAAIEKARKEQEAEKTAVKKPVREIKSKVNTTPEQQFPANDDKQHLKQLDKEQAWDKEAFNKRAALERKLKEVYEREKLVKTLEAYERQLRRYDTAWGRRLGKYKELSEDIEAKKLTLENIDMRIAEERSKLENDLAKTSPYQNKKQGGGQDLNPTIDFEKAREQREDRQRKRPSQDRDDDKNYNLDR
ncbi:MAG: hypothetical protein KDE33_20230, partial [Bacteroidetes bacterium]|nr:hypothetical protein [Bacteroidota bacterium]